MALGKREVTSWAVVLLDGDELQLISLESALGIDIGLRAASPHLLIRLPTTLPEQSTSPCPCLRLSCASSMLFCILPST